MKHLVDSQVFLSIIFWEKCGMPVLDSWVTGEKPRVAELMSSLQSLWAAAQGADYILFKANQCVIF